jgi:hypothetical protein
MINSITSNGKQYPVHIGILQLAEYEKRTGQNIGDVFTKIQSINTENEGFDLPFTTDELIILTQLGLNGGARKAQQQKTYTYEEAAEIMEESEEGMEAIFTIFAEGLSKSYSGKKAAKKGNAPKPSSSKKS